MLKKVLIALILLIIIFTNKAESVIFNDFNVSQILDIKQCLQYQCFPFSCTCCKKKICIPGDRICHYVPRAFVETPRESFESLVSPFDIIILALKLASGEQQAGGSTGMGTTEHLKFFESHMFVVPTGEAIRMNFPGRKLCNWEEANSFELNYVSEIDSVNWRTGLIDYLMPQFWGGAIANVLQICPLSTIVTPIQNLTSEICMGTWGVTYPRVGFSSVNSEALASAIAAWRTTRIVNNPVGRVVLMSKNLSKDVRLQLGYPQFATPNNCFPAGTPQPYWDNLTALKGERGFIWVIWEKVCCCKCPASGCVGY